MEWLKTVLLRLKVRVNHLGWGLAKLQLLMQHLWGEA